MLVNKKVEDFINKIICDGYSDPLRIFRELPDESVDCIVTSPPYWGLRNYNNISKSWKDWKGQLGLEPTFNMYINHLCDIFDEIKRVLKSSGTCWVNIGDRYSTSKSGIISKCLIGIPFRFTIEMINRGWILRNTIIWHKPNAMPSSVKDRFSVDFEYIFFFVKNQEYFFDQ